MLLRVCIIIVLSSLHFPRQRSLLCCSKTRGRPLVLTRTVPMKLLWVCMTCRAFLCNAQCVTLLLMALLLMVSVDLLHPQTASLSTRESDKCDAGINMIAVVH